MSATSSDVKTRLRSGIIEAKCWTARAVPPLASANQSVSLTPTPVNATALSHRQPPTLRADD